MKVFFDPIYSTNPRRCSSALKFKVLAQHLLKSPDNFIYWRIPEWADDADREWLPASPQIQYLPVPHTRSNRIHEYQVVRPDLADQCWAFGSIWDWDVCVTMRTSMIPQMRMLAIPPRIAPKFPQKQIYCLEEMAILTTKKTVSTPLIDTTDFVTIGGYIDSDATLIAANGVRSMILTEARRFFTPSLVMGLAKKLQLIRPVDLPTLLDKRKDGGMPQEGETPNVIFSGRMNASSSRLSSIFKVLTVDFALRGDEDPGVIVSSVSKVSKLTPPAHLEVTNNNRDQFWELLRNKAHVGLYMALDAEFSMTVIEPLCFGVPLVLVREDWSESLIGKDYPFYVNGDTEAYAMLKHLKENYAACYADFIAWRDGPFAARFEKGALYGESFIEAFDRNNAVFDTTRLLYKLPKDDLVHSVASVVVPGETIDVMSLVERTGEKGKCDPKLMNRKAWVADAIPASFKVNLQSLRLKLKTHYGAKDAGLAAGALRF